MVKFHIKELLEKSGKKKYWLVRQIDSNYTNVNKLLEGNVTGINFVTLEKLCRAFNCTPNDLFEIVDE